MACHSCKCSQPDGGTKRGLLAMFGDPHDLLRGTHAMKDAGMKNMDAFTPFPVHGMDAALSIKKSWVSVVTLCFALLGAFSGYMLQMWTSAIDWPLNVGGKPFNSVQAFVPIIFECTILFGGISTFLAALVFCGLPRRGCPVDPRVTADSYALWVPVADAAHHGAIEQQLRAKGAYDVRVV